MSRSALKCDIRKDFAHIDHGILSQLLAKVIGDKRLLAQMNGILASHADGSHRNWGVDLFFGAGHAARVADWQSDESVLAVECVGGALRAA